jgi:voltage-gated potassium channel
VLRQLEEWLETPMLVLGLAWLVLLAIELTRGLDPMLEAIGTAIWIIFIADFVLRLALAPERGGYLRRNWLTAVSLVLPALRIVRALPALRAVRAARAVRGVRLVKVVGTLNRGMRALGRSMGRRGVLYVATLTLFVAIGGGAGMHAFEREVAPDSPLATFGGALWWTIMILTTMGSEYWPRTAEGRVLCLLLALYAFAVFGYVTAALASFFVERDSADPASATSAAADMAALRAEIGALRQELRAGARMR